MPDNFDSAAHLYQDNNAAKKLNSTTLRELRPTLRGKKSDLLLLVPIYSVLHFGISILQQILKISGLLDKLLSTPTSSSLLALGTYLVERCTDTHTAAKIRLSRELPCSHAILLVQDHCFEGGLQQRPN